MKKSVEDIKFSLVIPTFNSERYITEALNSVLIQDYDNVEVIVIDGGSRDKTLEILDGYKEVVTALVSEPDEGQSEALNKGFRLASGDFFIWLNSDDMLVPGFLNQAASYLSSHPDCKWLTFNTIFIDSKSNIDFCYKGISWSNYCIRGKGPQVDCPTSIFHREIFLKSDGFDLRLNFAMDIDLWYQFVGMGQRWHRLDKYGYAFRMHADSKTGEAGYGAPPSPAKNAQANIIVEKHGVRTVWLASLVIKIKKLLFTKLTAWRDTRRWRKKPFREFSS